MSDARSRATIETLVAAINARDLHALDKVFTEDILMEWPQSGERIRGGKNRREIYSRFPSLPKVTPRRTTGSGDSWVLEPSLDYGDGDPTRVPSRGPLMACRSRGDTEGQVEEQSVARKVWQRIRKMNEAA